METTHPNLFAEFSNQQKLKDKNTQDSRHADAQIFTKLLVLKEESNDYLKLYSDVILQAKQKGFDIFNYDHLHHLVLQIWMDFPKDISDSFRKKLILVGMGHNGNGDNFSLPKYVSDKIKENIGVWLSSCEANRRINAMTEWLFALDPTGELLDIKLKYEQNIPIIKEQSKNFRKKFGISKEDADTQQEKAKTNGLCKFIRNGEECPHKTKCIFYHGKLEQTYGVQPCRNGDSCHHLRLGTCKFVHKPNPKIICEINNIHKNLCEQNGKFLDINSKNEKLIDSNCLYNPFFTMKKIGTCKFGTVYTVPKCACRLTNQFGIELQCNKPIKFMTKKNGHVSNFYCCYEHMQESEPDTDYVVKQSIPPDIVSAL